LRSEFRRVRGGPGLHEGEHLGGQSAGLMPAIGAGFVVPWMQQTPSVLRHETIGVEKVLLQSELRKPSLQVAHSIIGNTVPQDQILRARRRTDRIGLHEAKCVDGAPQCRRAG
jgi:hypothetical protein